MKYVTINWSERHPNYKERMEAISNRANGWFHSPLLNRLELLPKE